VNSSPVRDAGGNITGSVSVVRDITGLKKAEEELRRSDATLRGMLEATQESIWLFSADGVILQANQTALSRMGKTSEDVIGRRFNEICLLNWPGRVRRGLGRLLSPGSPGSLKTSVTASYSTTVSTLSLTPDKM
jgi:PAS domain-containing protein